MNKTEIIMALIVAVLGSAGLNGIITHILYNSKLKKEQKVKARNTIWNRTVDALEEIRKIELGVKAQEIYEFEEVTQRNGYTDFFKDTLHYPAIMNDADSFFTFFLRINNARATLTPYIDLQTAAHLYYMQDYAMRLMEYLKKNNLTKNYPLAGCFFFQDLLFWQKSLDSIIVKRLNKSNYKLYSEHGFRWEFWKKQVERKLWKKTILYKLVSNVKEPYIEEIKNILEQSEEL